MIAEPGTRRLQLSRGLTEFPREIFELADTLEVLDLSGNALATLPDDLHRLHRLRVLFCSDNRFTELPEAIGRCSAARHRRLQGQPHPRRCRPARCRHRCAG